MDKEQIKAYWQLSRVIKTIPEKAFETDPQAQQLAQTYCALEQAYLKFMMEINNPS